MGSEKDGRTRELCKAGTFVRSREKAFACAWASNHKR